MAWGLHYRWLCQFCWICSTRFMIFLRRIFITYSISRYSVIFLRFTSQLLSFLWFMKRMRKWSDRPQKDNLGFALLILQFQLDVCGYRSNCLGFNHFRVFIVGKELEHQKSIWQKQRYLSLIQIRWYMCIHNSQMYYILFTYYSYGVVHILRCQDFDIFWPPTYDTMEEIPLQTFLNFRSFDFRDFWFPPI